MVWKRKYIQKVPENTYEKLNRKFRNLAEDIFPKLEQFHEEILKKIRKLEEFKRPNMWSEVSEIENLCINTRKFPRTDGYILPEEVNNENTGSD